MKGSKNMTDMERIEKQLKRVGAEYLVGSDNGITPYIYIWGVFQDDRGNPIQLGVKIQYNDDGSTYNLSLEE